MEKIASYQESLLQYVQREYPNVLDQIATCAKIDESLEADIKTALDAFAKVYSLSEGTADGRK